MSFSENRNGALLYMTSSAIGVPHAFTTRFGGASDGIYASLNLGQNLGDDPMRVRRNYELLGAVLGFDPNALVFSRQVHGTTIRVSAEQDLRAPYEPIPYEADGLITNETNVPLIIVTADCVPILLYSPAGNGSNNGSAIGAVHAGWRGTVADIAGKAVRQMTECFGCRPSDIHAAIGPCISRCCFETGDDVKDAVSALLGSQAVAAVTTHGDKYMVDLKGINSLLLQRAGLSPENIDVSPECTACSHEKYWSHRVTKGCRGSQATVIMMKGSVN